MLVLTDVARNEGRALEAPKVPLEDEDKFTVRACELLGATVAGSFPTKPHCLWNPNPLLYVSRCLSTLGLNCFFMCT